MDDILQHYGVKGMKWGVIRNTSKATEKSVDGLKKTKGSIEKIKDGKTTQKASNEAKKMSDDELRKSISRLQMEQNYTRLLKNDKAISNGYARVQRILELVGNIAVTTSAISGIMLAFTKK